MISIREMTAADEGAVMEMVDRFYHSPAVEHEVDLAVLRRSFQAAVDPAEPLIQGLVLEEDGRPVGYHYMCIGYSAEVGGRYLLLDELYPVSYTHLDVYKRQHWRGRHELRGIPQGAAPAPAYLWAGGHRQWR